MRTPAKFGLYALALAAIFAVGAGIGTAVGPLDDGDPVHSSQQPARTDVLGTADLPAGLAATSAGYSVVPGETTFVAGVPEPFTFRIVGVDGATVTRFDSRHDKELHLVVVSADLASYQHLHPARSEDGTWSTALTLPRGGSYRAYADFAAAGSAPLTLATELVAAGAIDPAPLPDPSPTAEVDGYQVRLDGEAAAGHEGELRFAVRRGGIPVTDLEPYLGAYGHLVAIRATDHAYLHVHPTDASSPAEVGFAVAPPTAGAYRLFFDFQHGHVVRTAAFTLDVPAGTAGLGAPDEGTGHGRH